MTELEIAHAILIEKQPIRATDFVNEFMCALHEDEFFRHGINYLDIIEKWVEENEILEIEYVLPNIDYKIKSLYFHPDTKLRVNNLR